MTRRLRRILGTVGLVVFVLAYIAVAMVVGAAWFVDVHPLVQLIYFALAGVAWTVPAAGIILWMRRGQGQA
jgi:hypothetical protein